MRILGIDPGSRITGYGCIEVKGSQLSHISHGTLKLTAPGAKTVLPLEQRLVTLYEGLNTVIRKNQPDILVVEKVFFAKNASSALKLGHARGVVLLCGGLHDLEVVEYAPTEIKQALVGHGRAEKEQVAEMVQMFVGKRQFTTHDASDALAVAICHGHSSVNKLLKILREKKKDDSKRQTRRFSRRNARRWTERETDI